MDPQKRNLIIYDMQSGTKFILQSLKSSVRDQWLARTQQLVVAAKAAAQSMLAPNRTRSASEPVEFLSRSPGIARKLRKEGQVVKRLGQGTLKRPGSGDGRSPSPLVLYTASPADDEASDESCDSHVTLYAYMCMYKYDTYGTCTVHVHVRIDVERSLLQRAKLY